MTMQPVLQQIALALSRRTIAPDTTALRLCDGTGDGLPGVEIDSYDGHWVVQTRNVPWPAGLERTAADLGWRSLWWKRLDQVKEAPRHMAGEEVPGPFPVQELGLNYEIDLRAGYSQGLFIDQRVQKAALRELCRPGVRVLNLFAYTCAFSVIAAAAGAETTSVDLSRPYMEWGKRNLLLNGIDPAGHFFTRGDAADWLQRFAKKGRTWDAIVLDPPTFSRNDAGKVFRVEDDLPALVADCVRVLAPGGALLASTNHRGITPAQFTAMLHAGARKAGARSSSVEPGSMPPDFTAPPYLKAGWLRVTE